MNETPWLRRDTEAQTVSSDAQAKRSCHASAHTLATAGKGPIVGGAVPWFNAKLFNGQTFFHSYHV